MNSVCLLSWATSELRFSPTGNRAGSPGIFPFRGRPSSTFSLHRLSFRRKRVQVPEDRCSQNRGTPLVACCPVSKWPEGACLRLVLHRTNGKEDGTIAKTCNWRSKAGAGSPAGLFLTLEKKAGPGLGRVPTASSDCPE